MMYRALTLSAMLARTTGLTLRVTTVLSTTIPSGMDLGIAQMKPGDVLYVPACMGLPLEEQVEWLRVEVLPLHPAPPECDCGCGQPGVYALASGQCARRIAF